MKTGVYLLIDNKVVVYIGRTTRWPNRVTEHKEIEFDECRLFECSEIDLIKFEERFIRFFKPVHNSAFVRKAGKKMTQEWIIQNAQLIKKSFESGDRTELIDKARKELGYSPKYTNGDMQWTFIKGYERAFNVEWNYKKDKFQKKRV